MHSFCNILLFYYFQHSKQSVLKEDTLKRCVHFYACVCAFASDEKLAEEFMYYINLDSAGRFINCVCFTKLL